MRLLTILTTAFAIGLLTGCTNPPPPDLPAPNPEELEKARTEELKRLEGLWILKSSQTASEHGTYSTTPGDGAVVIYRIKDSVMELRTGDDWVKYATLAIGKEPEALLCTKTDAVGQPRVLPWRYKLDGDTLVTALDTQYPEHLPDSFDMQHDGVDRQRQLNTYVRIKELPHSHLEIK